MAPFEGKVPVEEDVMVDLVVDSEENAKDVGTGSGREGNAALVDGDDGEVDSSFLSSPMLLEGDVEVPEAVVTACREAEGVANTELDDDSDGPRAAEASSCRLTPLPLGSKLSGTSLSFTSSTASVSSLLGSEVASCPS